jgi:hypothetical protein
MRKQKAGGAEMTLSRRGFLHAGGFAAAGSVFATAYAATPVSPAASLADFGVEPNADRDQTAVLQKAIDALSRAGQPLVLPAGHYVVGALTLPEACALIGVPGMTVLRARGDAAMLAGSAIAALHLYGIVFEHADLGKTGAAAAVQLKGGTIDISHCRFTRAAGTCIELDGSSGRIEAVAIDNALLTGISAVRAAGLTITGCRISRCQASGIAVSGAGAGEGIVASQNQIADCGTGIAADGPGIITGNMISRAKNFGLRLGKTAGDGHIVTQANLIRDCRIGIGVTASGEDIMASLNFIHGAKDGAIRAFDGERLVGPDLVRQSAESYPNLMVAGNVAR